MKPAPDRIAFVHALRTFGERTLGLCFDGSFAHFVSRHATANWLYSVHPDRMESALPGNATFRFGWKLAQVRRWERTERRLGRHTYLYSAEAHGGPRCPITPSLLAAARARQGYVVLHEAWHSTLRLQHVHMPYALEEATGRVVGVVGTVLFAARQGDADLLREARAQEQAWGVLARFVNHWHSRLNRHYVRQGPRREQAALFRQIRAQARALRERTHSAWEHEELSREMNNALFFRYHDYTRFYPLAYQVYRRVGSLPRAMRLYKQAGRTGAILQLRERVRRG